MNWGGRGQAAWPGCPITDPPEHPFYDRTIQRPQCGRICIGHRKVNPSTVFAGHVVGIREVADRIWLVSFMDYDPGYFDEEEARVEPATNPLVPER